MERLDLEVSAAQAAQVQVRHAAASDAARGRLAYRASQAGLAELVPGARHLIAVKSGHYIHLDKPKLVSRAVRSVVRETRGKPSA